MSAVERLSVNLRKESKPKYPYDHLCLIGPDEWKIVNGIAVRRAMIEEPDAPLATLRLSSGIAGFYNCPAGDGRKIPKDFNEVIVGIGKDGIKALLELGALPCVTCHSEGIFKQAGINIATDFDWLVNHYDARLLAWKKILQFGLVPSRFYTRPGLDKNPSELLSIVKMFTDVNLNPPVIGFYDHSMPDEDKFHTYFLEMPFQK